VHGVAVDDGELQAVHVNGRAARAVVPDYSQWAIELEDLEKGAMTVAAVGRDSAGNSERTPHRVPVTIR
jgi:hypothetical protein